MQAIQIKPHLEALLIKYSRLRTDTSPINNSDNNSENTNSDKNSLENSKIQPEHSLLIDPKLGQNDSFRDKKNLLKVVDDLSHVGSGPTDSKVDSQNLENNFPYQDINPQPQILVSRPEAIKATRHGYVNQSGQYTDPNLGLTGSWNVNDTMTSVSGSQISPEKDQIQGKSSSQSKALQQNAVQESAANQLISTSKPSKNLKSNEIRGISIMMISKLGKPIISVGDCEYNEDEKRLFSVTIMKIAQQLDSATELIDNNRNKKYVTKVADFYNNEQYNHMFNHETVKFMDQNLSEEHLVESAGEKANEKSPKDSGSSPAKKLRKPLSCDYKNGKSLHWKTRDGRSTQIASSGLAAESVFKFSKKTIILSSFYISENTKQHAYSDLNNYLEHVIRSNDVKQETIGVVSDLVKRATEPARDHLCYMAVILDNKNFEIGAGKIICKEAVEIATAMKGKFS